MFRLPTAKAIVLGSVIAALCFTLNACTDSTGLASVDGANEALLRRSADRPGNSGWKSTATSLEITPDGFSIAVGSTTQLSVAARNRKGAEVPTTPPSWRSSDTTVARVRDGGVTAVKVGTALIVASVDGLADTVTATVTDAALPIDSIAVSPLTASVIVGQKVGLTAEALATDGKAVAGSSITWSTSDPAIATVTSAGSVTGVAVGSAKIKASAGGKSSSADVTVQPVPAVAVASVTLSPSPIAVTEGKTLQLTATTKAADGSTLTGRTITWASSNENVAKVSASGLLTGVGAGTAAISAMSEGKADTASAEVAPSVIAVASVTMNAASATLQVGDSKQLVATAKDAAGNTLTGRTITWASSKATVASVSSSGLVKALAAGSASITATVDGKSATSAITVEAVAPLPSDPPPADRVGFYVAPTGSSGASGTMASPWDLNSVLSGNKSIPAGDTVWVRGGTYKGQFYSYVRGTSSSQVVIRQYPGERATIDGNLVVLGSYVTFWGLEVMSSNPSGNYRIGVDVKSPGSRMVNLVVHDAGASGLGVWNEAPNAEVYGSIVYNNGSVANQDHGIYFNGNTGTKYIRDNIVFNNWQYGLHGYSPIVGELNNLVVDGNVVFNNGSIGSYGHGPDLFVGGSTVTNLQVTSNMVWRPDDGELALRLGDGSSGNSGLTLTGNYTVGNTLIGTFSGLTQSNNTFLSSSAPPTSGVKVVVRPNRYEQGRANIVVYNWSKQGSASADVSSVLRVGDVYEVRDAQNFFGAPVLRGTYGGGSLSLPMTSVQPPALIGRSGSTPQSTGVVFHAFVLLKTN